MLSDLDGVASVEQDSAQLPFITPWERTQHESVVRFPDFRYFIIEAGEDGSRDGFVILQGCRNPHQRVAFRDLHAQRFWLDVKSLNARALKLYASKGFVEEGRPRESVRVSGDATDRYDTLIVMSLLDRIYQVRQAPGLE